MRMGECNCIVNYQFKLGPHHKRYCNFHAWVTAYVANPFLDECVRKDAALRESAHLPPRS